MRLHYIKTLLLYFTITEANCLLSQGLCYVDVHYIDGLTLMGMILIAFSVLYFFPFLLWLLPNGCLVTRGFYNLLVGDENSQHGALSNLMDSQSL